MSKSLDSESKPLINDSICNIIIYQLEKKADFLCLAVDKNYILDAQKDCKLEPLKLWSTIKEDGQSPLKVLRDKLVREAKRRRV